jgi:xylulokinase
MMDYILAHDVGTSGNKAVLVDTLGKVKATAFVPYDVQYPRPGWAEQEAEGWWRAIVTTTHEVMQSSGVAPENILGMVHATQMLGIVPMAASGRPLRRGIIWLDARAPEQATRIMNKFLGRRMFAIIAGAELSGKDGLPKLLWLKENEPEIYQQMTCFLDVNGYLIYRATGKQVFEWSCASAFGFDLVKKDWLRSIIGYMGLDINKFPPLVRSIDRVGGLTPEAAKECGLLEGTPVFGGGGDAQAAATGAGAVVEGDGHIYLGTSGWVGVTTRKNPTGHDGIACMQASDPNKALLFSEMETAGACLKWIANEFYKAEQADPTIPNVYALMDQKVLTIPPGSGSLVYTPWMYGERSPVTDTWVRSTFFNLSADHTREHLLRAVYEGIAYNLRWMIEIVEKKFNYPLPVLRLIGGGVKGQPWMQIIADVTGRRVETVADPLEAGAVGIALTAGVGLGVYPDFESLKKIIGVGREFEPQSSNAECYNDLYRAYKGIYRSLRGLYKEVNEERLGKSQEVKTA